MCRIKKHFKTSMSLFTHHIGNEISKFNEENNKLKSENIILRNQNDTLSELYKISEDLIKAYESKIEELRFVIKELKMENEVRLINANAHQYPGDLINEPTINAKEIVIAEWGKRSDGLYAVFYCSACKGWEHRYAHEHEKMNYCPNCGAKVKEQGD